jgi:HlyD family secretion protein
MWIWLLIPLEAVIVAAFIAVITRSSSAGIYTNGIIENCFGLDPDHDCLQVRAYVNEALAKELPASSKLIGRMLVRETNTSVPLMFVRLPPYVPLTIERSDEWEERTDVPVLPVIFSFDPTPDLAVHPGQLVDVYIGER